MKKYIGAIVVAIVVLWGVFYMPVLFASKHKDEEPFFIISEEVLKHLDKCSSYQKEQELDRDYLTSVSYVIEPQEDNCSFSIEAETPYLTLMSQCSFDEPTRKEYVSLIRKLMKKTTAQRYTRSVNYTKLFDFISKVCHVRFQTIGSSPEFREHLQNCTPFMEEQQIVRGSRIRRVYGRDEDGKCVVSYGQTDTKAFTVAALIYPIGFKCALSDEQIAAYQRFLEEHVLVGGDIKDFSAEVLNLEHEMNFWLDFCTTAIAPYQIREEKN